MLYKRCIELMQYLISLHQPVTIAALAQKFGVSMRTVRNDMENVDRWLSTFTRKRIQRVPRIGVSLEDEDGGIRACLARNDVPQYVANKQERKYCILGMLLGDKKTNIAELARLFDVSQTTISTDMREVKQWLADKQIHLETGPHQGIFIQDSEGDIRRGFVMLLRDILETWAKQKELIEKRFVQCAEALDFYRLPDSFREAFSRWQDKIILAIEELKTSADAVISDGGFCFMWECLLVSLAMILEKRNLDAESIAALKTLESREKSLMVAMEQILERVFDIEIPKEELYYLAAVWQSLRKFGANFQVGVDYVLLAKELIRRIQEQLEGDRTYDEETVVDIATHLYLMHYRLLLNTPIERNDALNDIISEFPDACEASRRALLGTLKDFVTPKNKAACEAEAPYIAMHIIVGFYKHTILQDDKRDVVLVCGSSVATSKILENRLNALFSNINVVATMSYNEFLANAGALPCDVVISTIPLESARYQCITVSPLLKNEDINRLMNVFVSRAYELEVNTYIGATMNIITRALDFSPEKKLQLTIRLVQEIDGEVRKLKYQRGGRLCDTLTSQTIRTGVSTPDCAQAVRQGANILADAGLITQKDVSQLIRGFRRFGKNVVIDKGVAMPHLLAPQINMPCMSLMVLDKPVEFHNEANDPVYVVLTLVTNSSIAHIGIIEDIIDLMNDSRRKAALMHAGSVQEVLNLISFNDTKG
ncbi:MAG: BglG family transcription antiterminator [Candidatus Pelethousia sp.]|nr:BglG family transcription antiterminator [Candidatus Pelethousia sp.]